MLSGLLLKLLEKIECFRRIKEHCYWGFSPCFSPMVKVVLPPWTGAVFSEGTIEGRLRLVFWSSLVWNLPLMPVPILFPYDLSIMLWKSSGYLLYKGWPNTFISWSLDSGIYFLYLRKLFWVERTPWCFYFSSVLRIKDICLFLLDDICCCSPERFEVVFSRRDVPTTFI
jgi:hypothetical protein